MNSSKIALKVLTPADLSFFKFHSKVANQRALNLSNDVFIQRFFPGLKGSFGAVPSQLTVFGPGSGGAHTVSRQVRRAERSKDWRLDGEFIQDPDGEPGRYDVLAANDFAVMSFLGKEAPEAVRLVLVSASADVRLHATIGGALDFSGERTMFEVPEAMVAKWRAATSDAYSGEHPLAALVIQDTVEDVLFGAEPMPTGGVPSGRSVAMSPQELHLQLLAAEETGHRGETLFGCWLSAKGHAEDDFDWVSQTHARSAFDFEVHSARWLAEASRVFVAVKTTVGPFERPVHMSVAELRFAAVTARYRIARLYELDGQAPKLRILTGVQSFAARLIESLSALPAGVAIDSVQFKPEMLSPELEDVVIEEGQLLSGRGTDVSARHAE